MIYIINKQAVLSWKLLSSGVSTHVLWYTGANLLSPSLGYVSAIKVMDMMDGQSPCRRVRDATFPNIAQGSTEAHSAY
jgi:hypothetical protein